MKIEITLTRNQPKVGGGVTVVNYTPEFQRKLEDFLEQESYDYPDMNPKDSAYAELRQGYNALMRSIERILPQETEQPFQVVLNVEGVVDHSPGPRLY